VAKFPLFSTILISLSKLNFVWPLLAWQRYFCFKAPLRSSKIQTDVPTASFIRLWRIACK
jgi:hypothetical protein